MIFLFVALALLIAGGGGAVYWFYLRPQPVPETPEQMAVRMQKEQEEKEKARLNAPPHWHELATIPSPLYLNGKVRAYMFLGLKLDLVEESTGTKLDAAGPQLTEKLLVEFNEHPIQMVEGTQNPDLVEVKKRVKTILEHEFGQDTINDVLITMTFLQPF